MNSQMITAGWLQTLKVVYRIYFKLHQSVDIVFHSKQILYLELEVKTIPFLYKYEQ